MATYTALRPFWDGKRLHKPGDQVEYGGVPGDNLEPVDAEAKRMKAKAEEIARQAAQTKQELEDQRLQEHAQSLAKRVEDALMAVVKAAARAEPKAEEKPDVTPDSRAARREKAAAERD